MYYSTCDSISQRNLPTWVAVDLSNVTYSILCSKEAHLLSHSNGMPTRISSTHRCLLSWSSPSRSQLWFNTQKKIPKRKTQLTHGNVIYVFFFSFAVISMIYVCIRMMTWYTSKVLFSSKVNLFFSWKADLQRGNREREGTLFTASFPNRL